MDPTSPPPSMQGPYLPKRTVTVMVPLYNYGRYIIETLESLKAQTYTDWNCFVIDDGSEDDGPDKVREWVLRPEHGHLDVVFAQLPAPPGTGPARSRNHAAEISKPTGSEWLIPLDSDDLLAPDYMEKALAAAEWCEHTIEPPTEYAPALDCYTRKTADWVYTDIRMFWNDDLDDDQIIELPDLDIELLKERNHLNGTSLIRREMWDALGGHREHWDYAGDWEFWLRAVHRGYRPVHLREPLFWYRKGHSDSMMARFKGAVREEEFAKIRRLNPEIYGDEG